MWLFCADWNSLHKLNKKNVCCWKLKQSMLTVLSVNKLKLKVTSSRSMVLWCSVYQSCMWVMDFFLSGGNSSAYMVSTQNQPRFATMIRTSSYSITPVVVVAARPWQRPASTCSPVKHKQLENNAVRSCQDLQARELRFDPSSLLSHEQVHTPRGADELRCTSPEAMQSSMLTRYLQQCYHGEFNMMDSKSSISCAGVFPTLVHIVKQHCFLTMCRQLLAIQ